MATKLYFGDVLEISDKRMKYEVEKPFKLETLKMLQLKLRHAPVKGLTTETQLEMLQGKAPGTFDVKFKEEAKFKCPCTQEHAIKANATNEKIELEYEYTPKKYNSDGKHFSVEIEHKYTPTKSDWENKVEFKFGGFKLGPITPWNEIQFNHNKQAQAWLTLSQNLVYGGNYHFAWKTVHDAKAHKMTEAYGLFLYRTAARDYYVRSNCLQSISAIGTNYPVKHSGKHTAEVQWDHTGKNVGLQGLPLFVRYGAQYTLANKTKLTSHFLFGKAWTNTNKFEVPVGQNMKVTISDQCDVLGFFTNPKAFSLKFGFQLDFIA